MRVVHFVIDGFDPNFAMEMEDTGFKVFDEPKVILENYTQHDFESRKWSRVNYIPSNFSWARIYSGKEYNEEIGVNNPYDPENYNENNAHFTNYENISHDSFLWNKLSNLNVENYWFPYFQVTKMLRRTYKDIVRSDKTHMTAVNYNDFKATLIEDCKRTNIHYDRYTDFYSHIELGQKSDKLIKLWESENSTAEDFNKVYEEILNYGLSKACEINLDCYKTFLEDVKFKCELKKSKNEFIHLSSIELDAFYHYSIPSKFINNLMKTFYFELLELIRSELNPDVIIMTGDHGFRFFKEDEEHLKEYYGRSVRFVKKFDTEYGNIISTKAIFNDFPFSRTHNDTQGYIIFKRNDFNQRIPYVRSTGKDNPVSDDIYNLLCSKEFWNGDDLNG